MRRAARHRRPRRRPPTPPPAAAARRRRDVARFPGAHSHHSTNPPTLTPPHTHHTHLPPPGIPKFYRWLSERYPLINQPGGAAVVPAIDNFYLDMNGIVHNCTHGNDPGARLTEDEMMLRIFAYLDKLFHIVQPQKVMFMAVDGVAPRAKMNQQRARRFKSKREAEEAEAAALAAGEAPRDAAHAFDSNCITPGTPFMARLAAHLRFFVRRKIAEDPAWRKPTVRR